MDCRAALTRPCAPETRALAWLIADVERNASITKDPTVPLLYYGSLTHTLVRVDCDCALRSLHRGPMQRLQVRVVLDARCRWPSPSPSYAHYTPFSFPRRSWRRRSRALGVGWASLCSGLFKGERTGWLGRTRGASTPCLAGSGTRRCRVSARARQRSRSTALLTGLASLRTDCYRVASTGCVRGCSSQPRT